MSAAASSAAARFLARAAGAYLRGGWVFTGFHWPVLAGQVAQRFAPSRCAQIFEAGATSPLAAPVVPTSTTDYAAFEGALAWTGTSATVFPTLVRRADRVVLDAANVDLRGCVNATAIGPYERPRVRMPGGGGAADAAGAARELVLLHGGARPERIVAAVEHVTAAPAPDAVVRLVTRWATLRLDGGEPRIEQVEPDAEGLDDALAHLRALGVAATDEAAPPLDRELLAVAAQVLAEAAQRGYAVARQAA